MYKYVSCDYFYQIYHSINILYEYNHACVVSERGFGGAKKREITFPLAVWGLMWMMAMANIWMNSISNDYKRKNITREDPSM